ncbi:aminoglycoside phosphotransferase family protein [Microbacterium sp. KUDC0406]|uniref:aminoglycoside phosphotransferase family protein n=1 Tax=Microbacterium sp. KUDC0406 TaxID=2909588 RepID=UPI001F19FCEE|nr:aminoglycoside phosphotransferase family protein [Microbacterium sp. KUDC0406]UJP11160.1 aminoglycoside phosphotransferase family protein [Microbacterium sp. KUDC0406]
MITHTHDLTFSETEVRKRFTSWDEGEPDREWMCLLLLAQHAPELAPRPLRRETAEGDPVIVMERLPGTPLETGALTTRQTAALGAALRRLFDVPFDDARATGIGERRLGPSTLRPHLIGWAAAPHDLSALHEPRLGERALSGAREFLATSPTPAFELSVIGIADLNPANVLWDGSVCRLVDFEDGGLSDPAFELADHVEHLAGRGVYDADALIRAVSLSTAERERLSEWRTHWAVFWLIMLLPGNGGFRRNPPGTTEQQAERVLRMLDG